MMNIEEITIERLVGLLNILKECRPLPWNLELDCDDCCIKDRNGKFITMILDYESGAAIRSGMNILPDLIEYVIKKKLEEKH